MPLPASGAISLNQVNVELGRSGTTAISMNESVVRSLLQGPSGAVSMSGGYGRTYAVNIGGIADEGYSLGLTVPAGYRVSSVVFASYGTPGGSYPNYTVGWCHASNTTSVVQGIVLNATGTIYIPASNSNYGDPCGGTYKQLAVVLRCTLI